jgi:hypothetical protein
MTLKRLLLWLVVLGVGAFGANQYRTLKEDSAAAVNGAYADEEEGAEPNTPDAPASFGPARTIAATLSQAPAAPEVRMLFIGNSLTYTWAMPQMLTGLARASGINLVTQQHAPGGARLVQHASSPDVHRLLDEGGWTSVVLQEQSQWPAFNEDQVRREVDPHAATLVQRARAGTPGVRILFYGTPANKNGDPQNAANIPEVSTYDGMQTRLMATYRRLARDNGGLVIPAGEAWREVRRQHPDIELYGDPVHPNEAGAYLIACVFYGATFARSPVGNTYRANLNPQVAATLQQVAWNAVMDEASRR